MLAARFRKMLDAQNEDLRGHRSGSTRCREAERDHDEEIEAARLSREESLIVREADRALVLLREEGSSMAFPETVGLMRDDMQQVAERLAEVKVGSLTQELGTGHHRSARRNDRRPRQGDQGPRKEKDAARPIARPPASRAIRRWSTSWPS